jgi:hypothetical protein
MPITIARFGQNGQDVLLEPKKVSKIGENMEIMDRKDV